MENLAAEPDAARWAQICAWVPGTGHCRNRDCHEACIFHSQREAEARRVVRWRHLRRIFARRQVR
ncbi:MAG TPA: hypothetical protein VFC56_15735 [Stellaceae bacterium]|nr:hypothetical protein [Stellaceae bacterium]